MRWRRHTYAMTLIVAGLLGALMGPWTPATATPEPPSGHEVAVPADVDGTVRSQPASPLETVAREQRRIARELRLPPGPARDGGAQGNSAEPWRESVGLMWPWLHAVGRGPVEAGDGVDTESQESVQDAVAGVLSDDDPAEREAGEDPAASGDAAVDPAAAENIAGPEADEADEWVWPTSGETTSEFGQRWGRLHEGIDVANGVGTPVVAATDGDVSFAQAKGGYGLTVKIDHGDGLKTTYSHLSAIAVAVGDSVGAGQRLGAMGCTGSCTGPHVHFEVRRSEAPVNPRTVLP